MSRHLAIGDIHGCYKSLRLLCESIELQDDDEIITLGDYPDRGPNTSGVLDYLIHLSKSHTLRPLRGNHDLMMLEARESESKFVQWLTVGGDTTLRSYSPFDGDSGSFADIPDEHWAFLENGLLPYYETETHFFVHANACPDLPLAEQPDYMLYWETFDNPPAHESGKIMVCGHTSQKSGMPLSNGRAICIDTWAYGRGWLTCLHVESGRIWQANEQGEIRSLWLDDLSVA